MRHFRDEAGTDWEVYDVLPSTLAAGRGEFLPEHLRNGWLVFHSQDERRRLAPIPTDWTELPMDDLRALLLAAEIVSRERSGGDDTAA